VDSDILSKVGMQIDFHFPKQVPLLNIRK